MDDSTRLIPEIAERRDDLDDVCRQFGVRRLEVFGSAVTRAFVADGSDFDLLVEFQGRGPGYADRYFGLLEALEQLYGRPVDLVVASAIKNPFFRESLDRNKALLFAA